MYILYSNIFRNFALSNLNRNKYEKKIIRNNEESLELC